MKTNEVDMTTVFTAIDNEKPKLGSIILERQLLANAAKFSGYLDNGYSEEQIFNAFPTAKLVALDIDKKKFIQKLRSAINSYKKTLPPITAIAGMIPSPEATIKDEQDNNLI